jgi:hypothetical protein
MKDLDLYDVYENSKYAHFSEGHYTYIKPELSTREAVVSCEVLESKCKTVEEFNSLVSQYMNN